MLALWLAAAALDPGVAARFAQLALDCVHREYPNKIAHTLNSDRDARPPRELTPAFFGCYDWHSAVHGHWLLARLARLYPEAPFAAKSREALGRSLTAENIQREARYLEGEGRSSFERPYGLAWLLLLAVELREWKSPWAGTLGPLERAAVDRLKQWLPKLSHPVRSGEHSQTAFALGLLLDYARAAGDAPFRALLESKAKAFYLGDRGCPADYEPSGEDFVSPCLAEADVMRRVLPAAEFAPWFDPFLPRVPLRPEAVTDPSDGRLAHLDGLNLSRAWMLESIARAFPSQHARRPQLLWLAQAHREAGLKSVTGEHYAGGHWLGSFAVYLATERGR
ncbi:MAG: DUF2891 domain-containing protein [Acidobacteria bacterium]|nr:DUF2891 domain-containing protein [Acidobacteriota bacterium]